MVVIGGGAVSYEPGTPVLEGFGGAAVAARGGPAVPSSLLAETPCGIMNGRIWMIEWCVVCENGSLLL